MPELPEVETSRRGIEPHLAGRRIARITVRQPQLRWPVPVAALQQLQGETLGPVERRAKYLKLHYAGGYILVHLGMSGSLRVITAAEPWKTHDHIELQLDNGKALRYHDPRRFGCWLLQAAGGEHPLLDGLGPEPLQADFDGDYLYRLSRGKKQAVKSWIMDNHVVVGVGNIYAAESLFLAGIHPKRAAGRISLARYRQLADAIRQVLAAAITQGGTTLRDFTNSDGAPGYFQQTLNVYGRSGQPCRLCQTPVQAIKLGQRSTFYCSQCQK